MIPPRPWRAAATAAVLLLAGACTADDDAGPAAEPAPTTSAGTTTSTEGTDGQDGDQPGGTGEGHDGDPGDLSFGDIPDVVDAVMGSVLAVRTPSGEGSGVVFASGGIAVTNAHVVQDARTVEVALATGGRVEARVLGTDTATDLAVLQLVGADPPPLSFAEELPRVGSLAIAIGNPLGFENTVSLGVVSGLERSIPGGGPSLVGLIQTDAAISPGNSGGALVAATGEVIGINVARIPPQAAGGAALLGFAIPSPVVIDIVGRILAGEPIRHAYLGVQPHELPADLARELGPDQRGVVLLEVVPQGPGAQAGLRPGDVILAVDGQDIASVGELLQLLRAHGPGDVVTLDVWRNGQEATLEVTLGERPAASLTQPAPVPPPRTPGG